MKKLSRAAVSRLPRYFRCLRSLINSGVLRVSSEELAGLVGLSASQVRGDMCALGALGQQGYGYNVKTLYAEIASRLGAGDSFKAVIFGATPLGYAFVSSPVLVKRGVRAVAVLYAGDTPPDRAGLPGDCELRPTSELDSLPCRDIAVLACDETEAPGLYRLIADHGFRGLWNLTELELRETASLRVVNARIGDTLMALCYGLHSEE